MLFKQKSKFWLKNHIWSIYNISPVIINHENRASPFPFLQGTAHNFVGYPIHLQDIKPWSSVINLQVVWYANKCPQISEILGLFGIINGVAVEKKAFLNMLTRVLKNYEKLNLINFIHKNTKIIKLFCKLLFQHLKYCFLLQGSFAPQITMPNGHYELLSSVLAKKNYPIWPEL